MSDQQLKDEIYMREPRYLCRLYGLNILSDISLGLSSVPAAPTAAADIRLLLADCRPIPNDVPAGKVVIDGGFFVGTENEAGHLLRFKGLFDFLVSRDLSTVNYTVDPQVEMSLVPAYFVGTVMTFLLMMAHELVLHASAVQLPGALSSAIAVSGDTGAGKSTLAVALTSAGARFLTDDVLRVGFRDEGSIDVVGGCDEVRIRPGAKYLLDLFSQQPRTRTTADGRTAAVLGYEGPERVQLSRLIIPVLSRVYGEIEVKPLSPMDAMFHMTRNPRLAQWKLRSVVERQFDLTARLVSSVPAVQVQIPWSERITPASARGLLGVVASLLDL